MALRHIGFAPGTCLNNSPAGVCRGGAEGQRRCDLSLLMAQAATNVEICLDLPNDIYLFHVHRLKDSRREAEKLRTSHIQPTA